MKLSNVLFISGVSILSGLVVTVALERSDDKYTAILLVIFGVTAIVGALFAKNEGL